MRCRVACHGDNGVGIAGQYPTLAGQHADYLEQALTRASPRASAGPDHGYVRGADQEEDIRTIAQYYAKQKPTTRDRNPLLSSVLTAGADQLIAEERSVAARLGDSLQRCSYFFPSFRGTSRPSPDRSRDSISSGTRAPHPWRRGTTPRPPIARTRATICSDSEAGTRGSFSPCTTSNGRRIDVELLNGEIREKNARIFGSRSSPYSARRRSCRYGDVLFNYFGAPNGDINATVEAYAALRSLGYDKDAAELERARRWILEKGGLRNVRVFTRYWLALIGEWPWHKTPNLPPEVMWLPRWFPFCIYNFAQWARATLVPLTVLSAHRLARPLATERRLDELFPAGRDRFDYALPAKAPLVFGISFQGNGSPAARRRQWADALGGVAVPPSTRQLAGSRNIRTKMVRGEGSSLHGSTLCSRFTPKATPTTIP